MILHYRQTSGIILNLTDWETLNTIVRSLLLLTTHAVHVLCLPDCYLCWMQGITVIKCSKPECTWFLVAYYLFYCFIVLFISRWTCWRNVFCLWWPRTFPPSCPVWVVTGKVCDTISSVVLHTCMCADLSESIVRVGEESVLYVPGSLVRAVYGGPHEPGLDIMIIHIQAFM